MDTVKRTLGVELTDTAFDTDIILAVNTALMNLHQLGVGPANGLIITGSDEIWSQLLVSAINLQGAKTYVALKARLIFDPPTVASVLDSYNKEIDRLEWHLMVAADPPSS